MDPRVKADRIRQRLSRMTSEELLREGALKTKCSAPLLCEHDREPGTCAMCEIESHPRYFCTACQHEFSSPERGKRSCQSVAQFQSIRVIAFADEVVSRKITETEAPEPAPTPAPAPSPRDPRPSPPEDARSRRERERRERERRRREEEERHRLVLERFRIAWRHFWTTLGDRWNRLMQIVYQALVHGAGALGLFGCYTSEGFASRETGFISSFLFFIPALLLYAAIYHDRFGRWSFRKCLAGTMVLALFPGLQGMSTVALVDELQWVGGLISAGLWLLFFRSATVVAYYVSDRMTSISSYPGRYSSIHSLVYTVALISTPIMMATVRDNNDMASVSSTAVMPQAAPPAESAAPPARQEKPRSVDDRRSVMRFEITVETQPSDARVMIMNIRQKYKPGIVLDPGRYHVKVVHPRCTETSAWVQLPTAEDATAASVEGATGGAEVSHRMYRLDSLRRAVVVKVGMGCP